MQLHSRNSGIDKKPFSATLLLRAVLVIAFAIMCATPIHAALHRSTPQAQGVNTDALAQLINSINKLAYTQLHHMVILKNGCVVASLHASPYREGDVHNQFSACKTITALAVGLAIEDGKLSLDDKVADIFANKATLLSTAERNTITVRHLLTMTSGKEVRTAIRDTTSNWVDNWLSLPGGSVGKRFAYDSMSSFMLSAIIQHVTGKTMLSYLQERIFTPMGINDAEWELSPSGINTGGWGLRISTESMAMIGQLLLQRGQWNGKQLISGKWVDMMTSDQLKAMGCASGLSYNRLDDGYGFQVWRCGLDGAYRAQGNYGQLLFVYPQGNLVIAINCSTPHQMQLLNIVQQQAAKMVRNASSSSTTPQQLDAVSGNVDVPLIQGKQWSSWPQEIHLSLNDNSYNIKHVTVCNKAGNVALYLKFNDGENDTIALGYNKWIYSRFNGKPIYNVGAQGRFSGMTRGFSVAGNYAWSSDNKLVMQYHFVDWYSALTMVIDFSNSTINLTENEMTSKSQTIAFHMDGKSEQSAMSINIHKIVFIAFILLLMCIAVASLARRFVHKKK